MHIILSVNGTVTKTDQKVHHKVYLIKFQKEKIIQATPADQNLTKLDTKNNMGTTTTSSQYGHLEFTIAFPMSAEFT
jgi:hypothetical protein